MIEADLKDNKLITGGCLVQSCRPDLKQPHLTAYYSCLLWIPFMCKVSLWDASIAGGPLTPCNCTVIGKVFRDLQISCTSLVLEMFLYLLKTKCEMCLSYSITKHKTHLNSKFFNPSSWFCAWTDDACNSERFEPLGGLWIQGVGNQQCWCWRTQHAIKTDSNQSSRYPLNLLFLFITN